MHIIYSWQKVLATEKFCEIKRSDQESDSNEGVGDGKKEYGIEKKWHFGIKSVAYRSRCQATEHDTKVSK